MSTGLTEASDLILEDDTGILNANTFVAITEADAYSTLRQTGVFAGWEEADESNKVSALIYAAQYICHRWCYFGQISFPDTPQGLCFPRKILNATLFDAEGLDVTDTVPQQIKDAQIEYAARSIDSATFEALPLVDDPNQFNDDGLQVLEKEERVGPLLERTRFAGTTTGLTARTFKSYGMADEIVRDSGLIVSAGNSTIR